MFTQNSFTFVSFKMEVARALSSQKPGDKESCLSLAILDSLFSTSKKSLQNRYAISQSLYLFYGHAAKIMDNFLMDNE
jgi:hypothetical protein